jgi:hypothetical protein
LTEPGDTERAARPDPLDSQAGEPDRNLPVPAGEAVIEGTPARPLEAWRPATLPATVAAAAGGFLAGVVAFVAARLLRRRRSQRALGRALMPRGGGRRGGIDVAASRSFLVDIHLLRR